MSRRQRCCCSSVAGFVICCLAGIGQAQECGARPGPYTYSEQFYKAEARLYQSETGESDKISVIYDDVPIGGSHERTEHITGYQSMTIQQARQIVQQ